MCLMIRKNKNILIYLVIGIVLIVSIFFVFNKKEYKELPQVKIKGDINKSGLAIMVESDYKSGEYQKLDSTIFPTDGYTLNRIKSGCVDKNGKDVDALTYNENDKTISIKTKQSVYCYLYYDNLFKGKGTEEEPYQINYIEDLVRLSNSVNIDQNNYQNKNFKLMRDLDFNKNDSYMKYNDTGFGDINGVNNIEGIKDELTNKEGTGFVPIGNTTTHFQGNFNGNNKRLDNIFEQNKTDTSKKLGLFGLINNSEIKNLTISGYLNTEVITPVGGIAGYTYGNVTIDNCTNEINGSSICSSDDVGGLVGGVSNKLSIKNSINKGNISGGNNTGGLVGCLADNAELTIENSHNEGIITNEVGQNIGGLVGIDSGATSKTIIKNSYNAGEVTNAKQNEGGLVGYIYGTLEIENSYNSGKIKNTLGRAVGGLIGSSNNTSNITINNSYNSNKISCNPNSVRNVIMGGLIGEFYGTLNINNSYNTGNIENEKTDYEAGNFNGIFINEGGLIGGLANTGKSYINASYNLGNLLNGNQIGGIIGGTTTNEILIISNCYNTGNISALLRSGWMGADAGGIIGVKGGQKNMYILNSYNSASVEGIHEVGGLIGDLRIGTPSKNYIINSYNIGDITSNRSTGGIFNQYYQDSGVTHYVGLYYLNNVYNMGAIKGGGSIKQSIGYLNNEMDRTFKNAYYLEGTANTGTNLANDSELTTKMTESDMKNKTFVDTLNKNVEELNNAGLETIDENLKGYELEKWGLAANNTKIPVLTRKIEDLSGHGNHGLSYAVKYDSEGVTTSTDSTHKGYINAGLSDYDFGNSFSLVVRVKMNQIQYANYLIGSWETGGIGIYFNGDKTFGNVVYTDKYYKIPTSYDFNTTDWYTLLLTYDGSLPSDNLKMYVNGNLIASTNVTGNIKKPDGRGPIIIGGNPQYKYDENYEVIENIYATYKEALIFDRALTEEKDHISTNYKDDINVTI